MITLQVPDGENCTDCMFLDVDFYNNTPKCKLFNELLSHRKEYGGIKMDSILKLDRCPIKEATK